LEEKELENTKHKTTEPPTMDAKLFMNMSKLEQFLEKLDIEKLEEKLDKLDKLDKLEQMMSRSDARRSYEDIKKDIERLQQLIFAEGTSPNELTSANIQLEKVMHEYEATPEFQAEKRKSQREWRKLNEPLNKKAFEIVNAHLSKQMSENRREFDECLKKKPELRLISLSKEDILKKHGNDFASFSLNLTEVELRALRYCMPHFRKEQARQAEFVKTIETKIQAKVVQKQTPKQKPKKSKTVTTWKPIPRNDATPATSGSFLEELLKKTVKQPPTQ